jgi:hypothetical protein
VVTRIVLIATNPSKLRVLAAPHSDARCHSAVIMTTTFVVRMSTRRLIGGRRNVLYFPQAARFWLPASGLARVMHRRPLPIIAGRALLNCPNPSSFPIMLVESLGEVFVS